MPEIAPCPDLDSPPESARAPVPWKAGAAVLVLAAAFLPALADHARNLWARPHYQFFPVALVGAVLLFLQRLRGAGPLRPGAGKTGFALAAASWGLLAVAVLFRSSLLGAVAALLGLAALILAVGGPALFRRLFPAWAFLGVLIPPPLDLDQRFIAALQTGTARWSSGVLDVVGVYHVPDGHVVEIPGRRLLVEEGCSGIHSFFAVLPLAVFYVLWARRPWPRAVALVLAAAGWMLAANVARVAGVTVLAAHWGIDVTEGWRHEAFGFLVFAIALGLLGSTDRLLLFLTAWGKPRRSAKAKAPARAPQAAAGPPAVAERLTGLLGRRPAWLTLAAFGALAFAQAGLLARGLAQPELALHFDPLGADALPAQVGPWQRQGYETSSRDARSDLGRFSQRWLYQAEVLPATVSLDYPFPGWHELVVCYKGQGWAPQERVVHPAADAAGPFVEVALSKSLGQFAYLLFAEYAADGRPLPPPEHGFWAKVGDRLRLNAAPEPVSYQVQLLVTSPTPLTEAQRLQAQDLFRQARRRLRPPAATAPEVAR